MHSVYALCDPRTGDIRYIGQAADIHKRYAQHLLEATKTPKKMWLEELKQEGLLPTLIILEHGISGQQILEREMYWIAHYLKRGDNLTNIVIPGRAPNGHAIHKKLTEKQSKTQQSKPVEPIKTKVAQPAETMLSAIEAGKILGVSGKTLLRIAGKDNIPKRKQGRAWKFKRGEVEAYRDAQKYKPGGDGTLGNAA